MKSLIILIVFFFTFVGLFLLFSLAGLIWTSYYNTITYAKWINNYSIYLGWWMSGLVARDVYVQFFKSNKNDTGTDEDFIDDSINKKIP